MIKTIALIIGYIVLSLVVLVMIVIWTAVAVEPLYNKYGWFKKLYHDLLNCHVPRDKDSRSINSKCKHCGTRIYRTWDGYWDEIK